MRLYGWVPAMIRLVTLRRGRDTRALSPSPLVLWESTERRQPSANQEESSSGIESADALISAWWDTQQGIQEHHAHTSDLYNYLNRELAGGWSIQPNILKWVDLKSSLYGNHVAINHTEKFYQIKLLAEFSSWIMKWLMWLKVLSLCK